MQFFTDVRGRHFPVSDIFEVHPPRQIETLQYETHRVDLRDGRSTEVSIVDVKRFVEGPIQLIPADQGTAFLYPGENVDDPVHISTIVGWALCADGSVRAVTPAGVDDGGVSNADTILLHNGRVYEFEKEHADIEHWLKDRFGSSEAAAA